ncbi:MAG: hypothetical protein WC137_01405 [Alphaproteobacteria bacterium]
MSKRTMPGWAQKVLMFGGVYAIVLLSTNTAAAQNQQVKNDSINNTTIVKNDTLVSDTITTSNNKSNNSSSAPCPCTEVKVYKSNNSSDKNKCIYFIFDPKSR